LGKLDPCHSVALSTPRWRHHLSFVPSAAISSTIAETPRHHHRASRPSTAFPAQPSRLALAPLTGAALRFPRLHIASARCHHLALSPPTHSHSPPPPLLLPSGAESQPAAITSPSRRPRTAMACRRRFALSACFAIVPLESGGEGRRCFSCRRAPSPHQGRVPPSPRTQVTAALVARRRSSARRQSWETSLSLSCLKAVIAFPATELLRYRIEAKHRSWEINGEWMENATE
jgi:hypothetical protein